MARVLARRELNRKTLDEYVLDEEERFQILGPGRVPVHRTRREYTWYVRDGMHVRSPVRFNGVAVGEEARARYEASWIRRETARRERRARGQQEDGAVRVSPDGVEVDGGAAVVAMEPRFVSEAYFLEFKFEPGNYYLAGRERLEGHDVLRLEYYPTRMFGDRHAEERENREGRRRSRGSGPQRNEETQVEAEIERQLNKTALVTLWVDPAEHQIVKYTFENVWLDFLPGAWLVRMDEIRASMTMGQPFPGVWLPRELTIQAGVSLANGSFEATYDRAFSEYRLAEVKTRIGPPRQGSAAAPPGTSAGVRRSTAFSYLSGPPPVLHPTGTRKVSREPRATTGPDAGLVVHPTRHQERAEEVVSEIRVHGNAFLSDDDVIALAGIAVGDRLPPDGTEGVARRLRDSGRFEVVDVRKRYRSLTRTDEVALVLVVHERPGARPAAPGAPAGVPEPGRRPPGRLRSSLMFLPVLSYADGYGFTYGARFSTGDLLRLGERLSTPLTWGATRRAALEFERPFRSGPLTRVESSVEIRSRENPRFDVRDRRIEVRGRAERVFAGILRTDVSAARSTIAFGDLDDRLWTVGTAVALDTRLDPAFPANAVYLGAGWTALHFDSWPSGRVDRYNTESRGYLRIAGQAVLAGRAQYIGANAPLPPYERLLPGGAPGLRGFRVDAFDGDRALVTSAEVRVPLTSVLSGARFGVTAFVDAGKVWDAGSVMRVAPWHRSAGGGLFLIASIVRLNLDVARALDGGQTRVHVSSGFLF